MATVTLGYNTPNGFVSGETVTPAKLNALGQPTISAIVNADIDPGAAIALSKLGNGELPMGITVAAANLVAATRQSLIPAGAVMPFAMNSVPAGWLLADGSAVSRNFTELFSAIGTTFGAGDGSTTFNLPDLRGIFVRGSGSQTISGTTYNKTFAAKEAHATGAHTHAISFGYTAAKPTASAFTTGGGGTAINGAEAAGSTEIANTFATNAGLASETRPANIALLYCIKF